MVTEPCGCGCWSLRRVIVVAEQCGCGCSATVMNLSFLTSDFWAVLAALFLFGDNLQWYYFIAFAVVMCGVVLYHANQNELQQETSGKQVEYAHCAAASLPRCLICRCLTTSLPRCLNTSMDLYHDDMSSHGLTTSRLKAEYNHSPPTLYSRSPPTLYSHSPLTPYRLSTMRICTTLLSRLR